MNARAAAEPMTPLAILAVEVNAEPDGFARWWKARAGTGTVGPATAVETPVADQVIETTDLGGGLSDARACVGPGETAVIRCHGYNNGTAAIAVTVGRGEHPEALAFLESDPAPRPFERKGQWAVIRPESVPAPAVPGKRADDPPDIAEIVEECATSAVLTAIAALDCKVLPPSRGSGEPFPTSRMARNATARPWFLAPPGERRARVPTGVGSPLDFRENSVREGRDRSRPGAEWSACFLAAASVPGLAAAVEKPLDGAAPIPLRSGSGKERLAIIAAHPDQLRERLRMALPRLSDPSWSGNPRAGIFRGTAGATPPRTAWLFGGQGAQHVNMSRDLALAFPRVREWIERFEAPVATGGGNPPSLLVYPIRETPLPEERKTADAHIQAMEGGAAMAGVLNLALAELLSGVRAPCHVMAGHSNGENSALIASGILRMPDEHILWCSHVLTETATDKNTKTQNGSALAVALEDRHALDAVLERFRGRLFLIIDNCPHQVVLFGEQDAVASARAELEARLAICTPLPFSRPFHTPWFEEPAHGLEPLYRAGTIEKGDVPVYSCAHLKPIRGTPEEVIKTARSQFHMPVRFRELIERLSEKERIDLFLEVGPGVSLKAFVDDTLGPGRALSTGPARREASGEALLSVMAGLFVRGADLDFSLFGESRAESPARTSAPDATSPPPQPATPGGTDSVVKRHFELMNEFLASQRRVFESVFGGHASGADAPSFPIGPTPPPAPDHGGWPMLGDRVRVLVHEGERRLEGERVFTVKTDPFLLDHTLGRRASRRRKGLFGIPVIPFTFSMELLAEAAHRMFDGRLRVVGIEESRGHRWLGIDRSELVVRIEARVIAQPPAQPPAETRVRVELLEADAGGPPKTAFEGTVVLAPDYPAAPGPSHPRLDPQPPEHLNVADFYRFGMFHGPRFQNIRHVRHLSAQAIQADLQVFAPDDFFEGAEEPRFQLSPNLLDCAGQLAAFHVFETHEGYYGLFPFRVGALRIFAPPPPPGQRVRARGRVVFDGETTRMDFDYLDTKDRLLFRVEDKQQRAFRFPRRYHTATFWPESGEGIGEPWLEGSGHIVERVDGITHEFLNRGWGIWKRALAHMLLSHAERDYWYDLPADGPRRGEWLLGRAAAKSALRRWARRSLDLELESADIEILPDAKGRPSARCPEIEALAPMPALSISHAGETAVAVIDPAGNPIGIDFETATADRQGDWLTQAFTPEELELGREHQGPLLEYWCAKEAAAKAAELGLGGDPAAWRITRHKGNQITIDHPAGGIHTVEIFRDGNEITAVAGSVRNETETAAPTTTLGR